MSSLVQILYNYIFYFNVDIASLLRIRFNTFIYLAYFLNSQDIFKERHLSPHSGIFPWKKTASLPTCPGETQLFCTQHSKVETLI